MHKLLLGHIVYIKQRSQLHNGKHKLKVPVRNVKRIKYVMYLETVLP